MCRLVTEDFLRLLEAHFVVPEIGDVLDVQLHVEAEDVLERITHVISNFADGEVARGDVEYSRD